LSYFPVLLKIDTKKILLVGGGNIALFKFKKILEYSPQKFTVISKEFVEEFKTNNPPFVELIQKSFAMDDLHGFDIVIVGVDDLKLQQEIYDECQLRKVPCNCVDELSRCDFIFPSTIKNGDIVIAISSSGRVPGFSVALKDYISSFLPSNMEEKMKEILILRKSLPSGKERMLRIKEEAKKYFETITLGGKS
jgi:precorrin-2 dehydrogenase/sirohydrochlorin ferrochelatase